MKPFCNDILNFWANWADSGIQWWTATAELRSPHGLWTPDEVFFKDILNFWANRADQPNKVLGFWGVFLVELSAPILAL